ncbi:MAG TPA: ABC transporter ATP-binding protein, partial [Acidimicrobiales bacterium]
RVLGLDPGPDGTALRRRTGVLTENAGLDERFTAVENLVFVARLRGMEEAVARRRGYELLEQFGMSDRADVKVQGFSTGQRKRVALARSLLHDPELLFLDEPTSGLDPAATRDVVSLIGSLAAERGRTVVLCTHFLGEAGKLANRIAVLFKGQLHAFGDPAAIAATLWTNHEARLDLGGPANIDTLTTIGGVPGVASVAPTDQGAILRLQHREAMAGVVAALVARGVSIYAATPKEPTLEDVYFAIEAQAGVITEGGPAREDGAAAPTLVSR